MILKALTLENFKGIREPVRIELSPITLLFGPNNAGKSTVLHALIYAREIFERGNPDPRFTQMGGETIDLGGFDSLVFGNDRSRRIRMRFEFEVFSEELFDGPVDYTPLGSDIERHYWETHLAEIEGNYNRNVDFYDEWAHSSITLCRDSISVEKILDATSEKWIEIMIGWSEKRQSPLVLSCSVGEVQRAQPVIEMKLNEEACEVEVVSLDFGTVRLGKLDNPRSKNDRDAYSAAIRDLEKLVDKTHPALTQKKEDGPLAMFFAEDYRRKISEFSEDPVEQKAALERLRTAWQEEIAGLPEFSISTPDLLRGVIDQKHLSEEGLLKPFAVASGLSALPTDRLRLSLAHFCREITETEYDYHTGFRRVRGLDFFPGEEWAFPELVIGNLLDPLIHALVPRLVECSREFFSSSMYLSAIRVNPPRDFTPVLPIDPKRWSNGLAAWDLLFAKEGELLDVVNAWLNGNPDGFASGFAVEVQHTKQVDVRQSPVAELLNGTDPITLDQLRQHLLELPEHRLLRVRNLSTGAIGHPRDIGYGLSQLLPVIVAALDTEAGIVAVEEPESNIHPAFQVVLADLFIRQAKANPDALFLIETHSEHLMLRCLRRIRETSDGELAEDDATLQPEEIAVHFVEPSEGSPRFHRIRIDADGEFLDPWPRGFFAERMKEVYGDDL
jgi:ABC-type ATPase involved in cell division